MNNLALKPNVVGINNKEAGHDILRILAERQRASENTYKNYLRYYTEFFMFTCNKEINEITWEDILEIEFRNISEYKMFLLTKGDSPNYTNQKLFAGRALWKRLFTLNQKVDVKVFDFEEEIIEEVTYASLDDKEMHLLFEYMDKEKYKPLTKRLFFEFLYVVGCRKNIALTLKWKDITLKHDHSSDLDIWVISYKEKQHQVKKAINDDFYTRLLELKAKESKGEKVFDLNKDTFETIFTSFQKKYNLLTRDGDTVCIHSIKKASGWLVQNTFGDLNKTRKHLQHKNIQLTAKIYLGAENYSEQASYQIGKDVNTDFLKEMSKEDIIKLINKCGKDTLMKLYYVNEKRD